MRLSFHILSALVAFSTVVLSDAGNHQANADQTMNTSGQSTHPDAVRHETLVAQAQSNIERRPDANTQKSRSEADYQNRVNANTVTVISGSVGGSFIRVAADLATVLDDGDEMRVLGVLGKGALQNMKDIVYLKGVDIGIVRSDTLAYLDKRGDIPNLRQRVTYLTRLFFDEVHLVTRKDITSIEQLRGQKVNFDQEGSGANVLGTIVFEALNIPVDVLKVDAATGIEKLKAGEIAATLDVVSKPSRDFQAIAADSGLHLLPVPYTGELTSIYMPAELTSEDYPNLVAPGQKVFTLAVPSVLAVYNWPVGSERYRRVAKFTERLFQKLDDFQKPPRHPKWKDVDLTIDVPGWTRFHAAEEALAKLAGSATGATAAGPRADFETFLRSENAGGARSARLTPQEREELFQSYMRWRRQNPPQQQR